ncbi:GEM-like protein 4 [Durio zibethinus]|uniref:GEM-like protein 4 n=1 Tax=Durio zibethinus TaxID=66656 RepID=A0A6P5YC67_DURZI|nr:GEM-like protein 4 [Durio zibethinus]
MERLADRFMETPSKKSNWKTPWKHLFQSKPLSLTQFPSSSDASSSFKSREDVSRTGHNEKLKKKSSNFASRIIDHVNMGSKLSETVKGKLSLGARIIQEGGRDNVFKQIFALREGEELLKASQCYLSTTSGPIAGLLFISTEKVAFCSERSINVTSPAGQLIGTIPYKVLIPIRKMKRANQSWNVNNPAQKYIEIVTWDGFEFWFMGFLRYEKAFNNIQKALSLAS